MVVTLVSEAVGGGVKGIVDAGWTGNTRGQLRSICSLRHDPKPQLLYHPLSFFRHPRGARQRGLSSDVHRPRRSESLREMRSEALHDVHWEQAALSRKKDAVTAIPHHSCLMPEVL
jgi:hypothetical protein